MKKVRIIAFISALAAALLIFLYLSALKKPVEVSRRGVLVAKTDISLNTVIKDDMVELKQLPDEAILPDTLDNTSDAVGKMAKSNITAGEQILGSKLVKAGDAGSSKLAYAVTPGMRAITIAVDNTTGLSGMLRPGDNVDIIAQYSVKKEVKKPDGTTATESVIRAKVLLEGVEILAVDSKLSQNTDKKDPVQYSNITLQVTPRQALETSLTEYTGNMTVTLRSPLDDGEVTLPVIEVNDILGS